MRRAPDDEAPRVGGDARKRRLRRAEIQVELTIHEQRRTRVRRERRREPTAHERTERDDAAREPEAALEDRIRDPGREPKPEEGPVDAVDEWPRREIEDPRERAEAERLEADRICARAGQREAGDA